MKKVVCFGEIMLRLNPLGYKRFVQSEEFEVSYAGGEANVAVSLAQFGFQSSYVTMVPKHEIGQSAVNALNRYGVDTSNIVRGGERLGVYFVEKGASQRASKVIYDRANSAIALAKPTDFDWHKILLGADWFHFTGITPALGTSATQCCVDAVQVARNMGITVSCDLNYRKKLWNKEKAGLVMSELMPFVDVCIGNEEDAEDVFGIKAEDSDIKKGSLSRAGYMSVAKRLTDRFGFKKVAITLRGSISANDNNWSGMLYDGTNANVCFASEYPVHIVDRVGSGDSFGAGLIYALLNDRGDQAAVDFAVAASCLKHSIEFDFNLVTVSEVEALMRGDASGRVQR